MQKVTKTAFMIIASILLFSLAACQSTAPTQEPASLPGEEAEDSGMEISHLPAVAVSDQEITNSSVQITSATSDGPGWLVVHAQADGKPGAILGSTPVSDGENRDIRVEIDLDKATGTLYAMLHIDAGTLGNFEFPDGPDAPALVDGQVVASAFSVSGLMADPLQPMVSAADQQVADNTVTIDEVVSDGSGWLVIHAQAEGKPGPILGMTAVADGENHDVVVEIDLAEATGTLYAMLHVESGEIGTFEFPDGPDTPVSVDGEIVSPAFRISNLQTVPAANGQVVVTLSGNDKLGPYLADRQGMTLYIFAEDQPGSTNCYEQCAVNWPPMMLDDGSTPIAGESVSGDLNTINRDDGGVQLTYNGWPLYYWVNDTAPGDATGHGIGGVWAAAGLEPAVFSIIPGESQVTYEVGETFFSENRFNTAIGVTTQVEGMIMGDLSNPKSVVVGPITIDISQFKSDSERRDNKIRSDFLESARYPLATFSPTQIENLPQAYAEGEQLNLRISGDLTVKETTKLAVFDVVVGYEGGTITGEAATTILMSDFGVGPISILGMLETEDEVKLEFTFVAR